MVKVSVIVPVYNKEKEIEKCLDSILNQTLNEIEIIVVNDGSTDRSLELIKKYEKKYSSKIKVINHENHGIGYTRNKGIEKSTGEFISFVDSDDFIEKEMLCEYYNFCKEHNLDILTGYYFKVTGNKKEIFKNPYFKICNIKSNTNIINLIDYGPCNKIFNTKIIKENKIKFDENSKYEDMPFVSTTISKANKIGHIGKAYYNYYIREGSETTTVDKRVFDIFNILQIVNENYKTLKNSQELEYLNVDKITTYMLQQSYQKDRNISRDFIKKGYAVLNNQFPNWRKNKYYKNTLLIKRIIKNNKIILKLYTKIYNLFYR